VARGDSRLPRLDAIARNVATVGGYAVPFTVTEMEP